MIKTANNGDAWIMLGKTMLNLSRCVEIGLCAYNPQLPIEEADGFGAYYDIGQGKRLMTRFDSLSEAKIFIEQVISALELNK
jgi:hypothetical protein